jgi:hypothetical protein
MLDARGLDGLTQGDIDDLIEYGQGIGHSSAMARSLLMHKGYRFETQYVLPDPDPEPFIGLPQNSIATFEEIKVYPNPMNGDLINVTIPDYDGYNAIYFEITNLLVQKIAKWSLPEYHNTLKLPSGHDVLMYRIYGDGQELKVGRIIMLR